MALHAPEDFNGAKLLGVFESGTSEWHEARADGIGGSEVGTILGLNPWESPYYLMQAQAWLSFIIGKRKHGTLCKYRIGAAQYVYIRRYTYLLSNPRSQIQL